MEILTLIGGITTILLAILIIAQLFARIAPKIIATHNRISRFVRWMTFGHVIIKEITWQTNQPKPQQQGKGQNQNSPKPQSGNGQQQNQPKPQQQGKGQNQNLPKPQPGNGQQPKPQGNEQNPPKPKPWYERLDDWAASKLTEAEKLRKEREQKLEELRRQLGKSG